MNHADLAELRRRPKPGGPKGKDQDCGVPGHAPWPAKQAGGGGGTMGKSGRRLGEREPPPPSLQKCSARP
jgi:hypothetical protein